MESNGPNKLYAKSINIPVTPSNGSSATEHIPNYSTFSYSEDNSMHGSTFDNSDISRENIQLKNNQFDTTCSLVFKKNDLNSSHEINKRNKTSALSSALRASHHNNNNNNNNSNNNNNDNNNNNNNNNDKILFNINQNNSINDTEIINFNKNSTSLNKSLIHNTRLKSKKDVENTKLPTLNENIKIDIPKITEVSQKEKMKTKAYPLSATMNSNKLSLIPYEKEKNLSILRFASSDTNLLTNQHEFLQPDIEYLNSVENDHKIICRSCQKKLKNQLTKSHHHNHHQQHQDNYISLNSLVKISNVNSIDIIGAGNDRNSITTNTLNRMLNSPSYSQLTIDKQQYTIDKLNNKEKSKVLVSYYPDDEINNKINAVPQIIEESIHISKKDKKKCSENDDDNLKNENNDNNINNKQSFMECPLIEKKIYSLSLNDSDILKDNRSPLTPLSPLNNTTNLFDSEIELFHPKQPFNGTEEIESASNELINSKLENIDINDKESNNNHFKSNDNHFKSDNNKNDILDNKESLLFKPENDFNQNNELLNNNDNDNNNRTENQQNQINESNNDNNVVYNLDSLKEIKDNINTPISSTPKNIDHNEKSKFTFSQSNADILHMNKSMSVISIEMDNDDKSHLSRLGSISKGSFDEDDMRACSFENEEDIIDNILDKSSPTSLPLLPYGHQVGGHAPFLRFSDKALCKLMNPAEKAFYESINNIYPQLRPFIPGYYGVINVYFNNSNSGNGSTWADNIPVAVIENENYTRVHNQSLSFDSGSKSSSQSLSTSPTTCNEYINHNHGSCSECGKPNVSPSLSHNDSEISINKPTSEDSNKNNSAGITINNNNNKKIPIDYLSTYTDGESQMHFNYYQKLREKVLRDALTVQNRRYRYSQLRASSVAKLKRRHSLNAISNDYQGFTPLIDNKSDIHNNNIIEQNINPWSLHCLNNQINKMGQSNKEGQKPKQFILIEDLTYGMKYPCILDLKMGTRQHGVDATPQKRKSQEKKCESTTSKLFGVRMCGMQVYKTNTKTFEYSDKYKGRKIVASHFKEGLLSFLDNGEKLLVGFIPKIVEKLKTLYSVVEQLTTSRFYASSLMLFYDGAWADEENEDHADSNLLLIHNSNEYNNNNDEDEYSTVKRCLNNKEVVVHLIDFAHCTNDAHLMVSTDPKKRGDVDITKPVYNPKTGKEEDYILVPFPPTHKGPDMGYLLGVRNLIMFFEEIYRDFGANGHVYKKDYPEIFNKQNTIIETKE